MSHRLEVLRALVLLAKKAMPAADVYGLEDDADAPMRVGPGGQVVIRSGNPGEPETDLSPLRYHYDHRIPVEIIAPSEAMADAMMVAFGEAIEADRQLGGLCSWIEPIAPETEDVVVDAAAPQRGADLAVIASYTTTNPLT